MSTGEGETGGRVIETGTGPTGGVVALGAVLREAGLYVIRAARVVEVRLVASDASRAGQTVGTRRAEGRVVALIALQCDVCASQREAGGGMVKARGVPRGGGVALLASRREAGRHMVRIGGAIEVRHMARGAIRWGSDVLTIDMALRAANADVGTGQREFRESVVIESRRIPRGGAVAGLASGREPSLGVRRVVGLIEVRHVAAVASCGRIVELSTRVAGGTIEGSVGAGQGKASELQVIKLGAHPIVHGVALFAGHWQTQRNVVDADRLGADEILLMAGVAGRGKALELSDCGTGVALIAVKRGVRANQWEAVQVLIDLLHRNVPSLDGVALLAIRAHLALVNVSVAIGALFPDIGEDRLGVALNAAHTFMHAA